MAAASTAKIVRLGAGEGVIEALRQRIVDHDLTPGTRLREQDLASEFGVSRARIRDAFNILEERGLIERIPNRGALVAKLDPAKADELFEVREVLEAQMVRLATEKAPAESWDDLIELFGDSMGGTLAKNDLDAYEDAVHLFRQRCIAASENEVPGRAQAGMRQHQEILAAMRAGKAEKAEKLKRQNIRSAREWFHNYRKYLL
jgi:DNA-binding GntR family transcriptional regulator